MFEVGILPLNNPCRKLWCAARGSGRVAVSWKSQIWQFMESRPCLDPHFQLEATRGAVLWTVIRTGGGTHGERRAADQERQTESDQLALSPQPFITRPCTLAGQSTQALISLRLPTKSKLARSYTPERHTVSLRVPPRAALQHSPF